jgi:hypothetical protein
MAKGFSPQTREVMYQVIQFVISEKNGITIPLHNVNDRLCAMLGISSRSVDNLKKQLKDIESAKERSSNSMLRSGSNTLITVRIASIGLNYDFFILIHLGGSK